MGFNSAFKGLMNNEEINLLQKIVVMGRKSATFLKPDMKTL